MNSSASSTRHVQSESHRVMRPLLGGTWLLVLLGMAIIWLSGLDHRPLLTPDEGRYAEIAREMAVSGDYVTPFLNGLRYFEKPPLQAWIMALSFELFGIHDAVVRLIPTLYGLLTCLVGWLTLGALGRAQGLDASERQARGQMALLISAACPWVILNAHFVSLDMGLTFWFTVTLAGLVLLLETLGTTSSYRAPRRRIPLGPGLIVWAGLAGGFLSKGLVALVIPGAVWFVTTVLIYRRWSWLSIFFWWPGWVLWIVACVPWLLMMESRNPGFLYFFFIHEHFLRYTTVIHQRVEPWWYFLPILLLGLGPWLLQVLAGLWDTFKRPRLADNIDVLLMVWSLLVLLFFSASGSKLPSYILPMFPALAWWLARRLPMLSINALRICYVGAIVLGLVMWLAAFSAPRWLHADDVPMYLNYRPWLLAAFAMMALGGAFAMRSVRDHPMNSIVALAFGMALACQLMQWGHATYGEQVSSRDMSQRLLAAEGEAVRERPFYSVAQYDQSLPFYLRRTLTLVDYRDEMGPGLDIDPKRYGPSGADLRRIWRNLPPSYAVIDSDSLAEWQIAGASPPCVIARNLRRSVITNRPGAACLAP